MTLDDLIAIEEIKQLKARYFRLMDQGRWDEFRELFCEEVEQSAKLAPDEAPAGSVGRDVVVAHIRDSVAGMRSVHHGHMPEIEIEAPDRARGIWALYDHCTEGDALVFRGAGFYEDTYVKRDGRWLIQATHLDAAPFPR